MKILLTATVQSHIVQFHKPLVEMLHSHGCEVHVAARDNLAEKNGLKLDFVEKIYNIPFARSPKSPDNIKAYKQLKRIIDEGNYDVVHCNTPMGGIVTRLASMNARINGTKVLYTAHGFHFYKGAPVKNWLFYYPIEKIFSRATDVLITITKEDYNLAQKKMKCNVVGTHGVGVDMNRFHDCSQTEREQLRSKLGFKIDDKIILCVGELNKNKNQEMIISVIKQLVNKESNIKLLLAGNGPNEKYLKDLADGYSNSISFLGYVTNLEMYQRISDISVSCSKREGLPLNIVEAMLTRVPVVATKNRGHIELIDDGKEGYLVDVDDYEEMKSRILLLLSNQDERNRIVENAYKKAIEYSWSNTKRELELIYKENCKF